MRKKSQYYIEYISFRFVEELIHFLPRPFITLFAKFVAFLSFKVIKYRRKVALENLAKAFPEKSDRERFAIAYGSYRHFAHLILEFMKLSASKPKQLEKMIEYEKTGGFEKLVESVNDGGAIIVSGHFGNWETGIALLAANYFNGAAVIQQRQKNSLIDQHVADMRRRWGIEIIYSRGAVHNALDSLRKKCLLALLCDQDAGKRGAFVPFFGRRASTPVGAAVLHIRSRVPLFFGCNIRTGPYKYQGKIIPLKVRAGAEVNQENIEKITAEFTAILEKYVRKYPEQYLWMHRRWKTAHPAETKSVEGRQTNS